MNRSLLTILVVDDEPLVRQVLEVMLERDGYTALSVRDVKTALDTMRAATVDLAIVDVSTADPRAVAGIAEMRRQFPWVKVIAMSGAFGTYLPAPSTLRVTSCLAKPIRPESLRDAVDSALVGHTLPLIGAS